VARSALSAPSARISGTLSSRPGSPTTSCAASEPTTASRAASRLTSPSHQAENQSDSRTASGRVAAPSGRSLPGVRDVASHVLRSRSSMRWSLRGAATGPADK
jgi:hypothetical protein